jgi:8-amino-7-oxononanoate synthase
MLCMDGANSMTGNPPDLPAFAALARDNDALLYLDDAHGFGIVGERGSHDPTPYGRRGNAVVRWFGEGYDHIVLTAGFSKAYSSLLAFAAIPAQLRPYLKATVPSYMYSGPVPVASLATARLGLEVNRRRGDDRRAQLDPPPGPCSTTWTSSASPPPTPAASPSSSWPWPTRPTWTRSAASCSSVASTSP